MEKAIHSYHHPPRFPQFLQAADRWWTFLPSELLFFPRPMAFPASLFTGWKLNMKLKAATAAGYGSEFGSIFDWDSGWFSFEKDYQYIHVCIYIYTYIYHSIYLSKAWKDIRPSRRSRLVPSCPVLPGKLWHSHRVQAIQIAKVAQQASPIGGQTGPMSKSLINQTANRYTIKCYK